MNKLIKKLLLVLLILGSAFLIISCGKNKDEDESIITEYNGNAVKEYTIHTELQAEYLSKGYEYATLYGKGKEELSKPQGIEIDFSDIISDSTSYEFYLDLSDKFDNARIYNTTEKKVTLYNLMIMKVYYYKVKTSVSESEVYAFVVKEAMIRNLDIDGVTNARDVGGYKVDGKRINQGLLYRMSKFNEDESLELLITDQGINELVNVLKVKTELDLRQTDDNEYGGLTSSPLGDSVKYINLPMTSGGNCILLNKDELKDLFKILGDESNYPLVFHCSIGTDRTGMVSFLALNLLGVSRDEIYYDYLFSNFAPIGRVRLASTIDDYYRTIEDAKGKTDKEKTYNYLLSVGVDKKDLDKFINIMTK